MANPFTSPSISGYNSSPPPDDGSQVSANQLKWATHKTKLADPLKTYVDDLVTNTNAAFATVDDASKLTTGILPDARLSSNVPLKNASNTFTSGTQKISAASPLLRFVETDASTDNGVWDIFAGGEDLLFRAGDDAENSFTTFMTVKRTGGTVDSLNVAASSVQANGKEVLTEDVVAGLTNIDVSQTQPQDSIYVNDGGAAKQMDVRDMGVRVVNLSTTQTFALDDANTLQTLTGSTDRAWTIPANATTAFHIGAAIYLAARDTADISVSPASGVTLTSVNGSATSAQTVLAGGMAVLIKVATDEWMLSGDIA